MSTTETSRGDGRRLKPLLGLAPFALRHKGRIALAVLALIAASAATLVVPLAVRRIIDFGFTSDQRDLVDLYFETMILIVAALALASASRYYLVMTLGERVVSDIRSAVFRHLTRLSPSFYDDARAGELVSRLTADTTLIKAAFGASASIALRNFFLFIGAATMMVITSPRLSALLLIAIPFIVLPLVAFGRSVRRRSRAAQDTLADASALAGEAIGAMRTVQAFTAESGLTNRFDAAVERAYSSSRNATAARAVLTAIIIFLVFASVVAILWWGATDVLAGRMSAGTLGQFVLYAVFAAGALGEVSQVWAEISQAAGAAERLGELLRIEPEVKTPALAAPLPVPPRGEVRFENISFAYPARPYSKVLNGIDLGSRPARRSRSSVLQAPANPPSSTSCCASTTRSPAVSCSTAWTSRLPISKRFAAGWHSCRRTPWCSPRPRVRTSASDARKPATRKSKPPPAMPPPTASCVPCRTATRPRLASAV